MSLCLREVADRMLKNGDISSMELAEGNIGEITIWFGILSSEERHASYRRVRSPALIQCNLPWDSELCGETLKSIHQTFYHQHPSTFTGILSQVHVSFSRPDQRTFLIFASLPKPKQQTFLTFKDHQPTL